MMNIGERSNSGVRVQVEHAPSNQALSELRRRLGDGLARARLSRTQLASKAKLGRTTVYEALRAGGPVPSPETVAALANVLKLPEEELLDLLRRAAAPAVPAAGHVPGPGRPLSAWDPHDLEVHPAGAAAGGGEGTSARERRVLSGYVPRQHDQVLAAAVRDVASESSRMVVLVGTSSTGKTRACWEAVQPLAALGWRLWHPFDPGRAEAALKGLHQVRPRTVVWLNEAQHYLGDPAYGERIAAAVHHLLIPERAPVLILGTLWPEYADRYTALPAPDTPDPHSRARELLSARTVSVPDTFDEQAIAGARALAETGDVLLAEALSRADGHGRVAQDLAGAPELLRRYEDGSPAGKAILGAAMDARRLGVGLRLPQAFLTDAALDYLAEADFQQLSEDWAEAAYAELAQLVHGKQAPLSRIRRRPKRCPPGAPPPTDVQVATSAGQEFWLADYLEQHGRTHRRAQCPPASFWHAAHTHLTSADDLDQLAQAATRKHRLQWAHHLRQRAADAGSTDALHRLAEWREKAGDREGAEALLRRAADAGHTEALCELAKMREEAGDREGAEALLRKAADAGNTRVLSRLARLRKRVGDREGGEALLRRAASADPRHWHELAEWRMDAADWEGAEAFALLAADAGMSNPLYRLALRREAAGDREGAKALLRRGADAGSDSALGRLAGWREQAGDREGAEALALEGVNIGKSSPLHYIAMEREAAGDREGAEALLLRGADAGNTHALYVLAGLRKATGDRVGAEALLLRAVDAGHTEALCELAMMREEAGDREGAEALALQAADAGNTGALSRLAIRREEAGDREDAEALALQVAVAGGSGTLRQLAMMREEAGDREGGETLLRRAANASEPPNSYELGEGQIGRVWPYGLDPDGTPTAPWL
jgi:hypothetical protein